MHTAQLNCKQRKLLSLYERLSEIEQASINYLIEQLAAAHEMPAENVVPLFKSTNSANTLD
jgi:hypothetical protein